MTGKSVVGMGHERNQAPRGIGMTLYWAAVTVVSLLLLGATIQVATPADARQLAETAASR